MQLKQFQDRAIETLKRTFYELWRGGKTRIPLVFKSPTGSGKTIMLAEFLRRISGEASFNPDKCFVWISKGDLAEQSKRKLEAYYANGVPWTNCLDLNDLNRGKLKKNELFFVNWEKIISRAKDNRRLRKSGESTLSFDDFIKNTQLENREIVLIVDESHLNLKTQLAQEIIDILNPRIAIHLSATPDKIPDAERISNLSAGFVSVKNKQVVAEGLIKSSIKIMPKEEIELLDVGDKDLDELLLDLALEKQREIQQIFQDLARNINPLILVQLPNDEGATKSIEGQNKLEFSTQYLQKQGLESDEIAVWLSAKKENLANIVRNNSPIKALIFKQAIATGWDCPRAQILVSFREMKNPIFHTQVLGRILRMPEAKHYDNPVLNHSYCYTNYAKNELVSASNKDGENEPKIHTSYLKNGINNIALPSVFLSRTDYNDLGAGLTKNEVSFEAIFIDTANQYFDAELGFDQQKLLDKGLDINATTVNNTLIIDAQITVYDDFIRALKQADSLNHAASYNDVKKLYDLLIYQELSRQESDAKFGNIARSVGKLKAALNVWLKQFIPSNPPLYAVVCNDLVKGERSILKIIIERALKKYKPIRAREVLSKAERMKQNLTFGLLSDYAFDASFTLAKSSKNALYPFYENHQGDEDKFAHFLDNSAIDWWFKNADNGKDALGIEYIDYQNMRRVFYPDFIIRRANTVLIFDTKKGFTAREATEKAQALYQYCQTNKGANLTGALSQSIDGRLEAGDLTLAGGIVQLAKNGIWKTHNGDHYDANINHWCDLNLALINNPSPR